MIESYTLEVEGGYHVEVEYEYNPPELGYTDGTGFHGGVTIYGIFANLPDEKGKLVKVDVLHFVVTTGLVAIEELEEYIYNNRD